MRQVPCLRQCVDRAGAEAKQAGNGGGGKHHQASASSGLRTPLAPVLATCV
jgi:hypothetical protein